MNGFMGVLVLFSFILWLPLFLAVYFMPSLTLYFRPWICHKDVEEFDYPTLMRWYSNWIYRVCNYKCKIPAREFRKTWLPFSLVYSLSILVLLFAYILNATDLFCLLGVFALLFGADFIFRGWSESSLSRRYERVKVEKVKKKSG